MEVQQRKEKCYHQKWNSDQTLTGVTEEPADTAVVEASTFKPGTQWGQTYWHKWGKWLWQKDGDFPGDIMQEKHITLE